MLIPKPIIACGLSSLLFLAPAAHAVPLLSETFSGAASTQPAGFSAFTTAGITSQNDGSGEYEQRRTNNDGSGQVAVGLYNDSSEVDKGLWRDVTITSNTRYSGGADNDNGVIFRARDVAGTGGASAGSFYMVRAQNNNSITLFRNVGGIFTQLDSTAVNLSAVLDRDWQINVSNVSNAGKDNVRIQVDLLPNGGGAPVASIDFTDTSASALTRAGGVGYRSFNTTNSTTRSTFDDLVVESNDPNLLWYDDYTDGAAPRMASPSATGSRSAFGVTGNKLQSGGGTGTAISSIDFSSWTGDPLWEDVQVTALMRLNTNNNSGDQRSGIFARGNDISSPDNFESEYYLFRLNRLEGSDQSEAQLLRKNANGGFDVLETLGLDSLSSVPESENIFLDLRTTTLATGVLIEGFASLNDDFSSPFGEISFLDSSANRILGPGTAGVRVFGTGVVNYDNFTVRHIEATVVPEPATAGLLLLGVAGIVGRRRRSR